MTLLVQFKVKLSEDGGFRVPKVDRRHVDMSAARKDKVFGSYANSDMFVNLLHRAMAVEGMPVGRWAPDELPSGVTVDKTGFLAVVTVPVEHWKRA